MPLPPTWPAGATRIWFELAGAEPPARVPDEVVVACHLLMAMRMGRPLVAPPATNPELLRRLPAAIDYLTHWNPELHPVRVSVADGATWNPDDRSAEGRRGAPAGGGRAVLFSGGAKSLRWLQRQAGEPGRPDALVVVEQADGTDDNRERLDRRRRLLQELAAEAGCRLVVVTTNLSAVAGKVGIDWPTACGVVLAATAHLLADQFPQFLLAGGAAGEDLPWSLRPPVLDAWSGGRVRLAWRLLPERRSEMVAALQPWPPAAQLLAEPGESTTGEHGAESVKQALTRLHLQLASAGAEAGASEQIDVACGRLADALEAACATSGAPASVRAMVAGLDGRLAPFDQGGGVGRCRQWLGRMNDASPPGHPEPVGPAAPEPHWPPGPPVRAALESFAAGADSVEWRVRVSWGEWSDVLWIQLAGDVQGLKPASGNVADTLFCWLAPMAMKLRVPLEMAPDLAVDPELFERWTDSIGVMRLSKFMESMRPVPMAVTLRDPEPKPVADEPLRLAAAFSGGVDACSMAVALRPRLLLYAAGMDTWSTCPERLARAERKVGRAARAVGIPMVILRTNLRELGSRGLGVNWRISFRLGIPAAAHLLAGDINVLALASDDPLSWHVRGDILRISYTQVHCRWLESSRVRQEYWGEGPWRAERLGMLRDHPEALAALWTCQEDSRENYDGEIPNCGECEKCLRNQICHLLAGLEPSPRAFAQPLRPELVDRLPRLHGVYRDIWSLVLERLRKQPGHDVLLDAVERLVERSHPPGAAVTHWMLDDRLVEEWRGMPEYPAWLREHGDRLAAELFADGPAAWARQRLAQPGAGRFRTAALKQLWTDRPGWVRRWLLKQRWRNKLGVGS